MGTLYLAYSSSTSGWICGLFPLFFAVSNRVLLTCPSLYMSPVTYGGEFLQVYVPEEIVARSLG